MIQTILKNYEELDSYFKNKDNVLLVCGKAYDNMKIRHFFDKVQTRTKTNMVRFSDFEPNPRYESVIKGIEKYRQYNCDSIVAVGGGSAIDVAKCIKMFCNMDTSKNCLSQEIIPNDIEMLAIPTTAGTGAESTRFAVIYYDGQKQSVANDSGIPRTVFFDEELLDSLPLYQRKATMLDALCHAVEAYWSVNSTDESKKYSVESLRIITNHIDGYLENRPYDNKQMLLAANLAGRAINIAQTTAGHAMCYKITSLYGISHGHSAALCVAKLYKYMLHNINKCEDSRGEKYLKDMFTNLAHHFGVSSALEGANRFQEIVDGLVLEIPHATNEEISILVSSVNVERLKNNPIKLDRVELENLYREILV